MINPFAQFEIIIIFDGLLTITNFVLFLIIVLIIIMFFLNQIKYSTFKENVLEYGFKNIHNLILNMIREQAGEKATVNLHIILTTFLLILVSNVIGLLPYSFTITSHIAMTILLSLGYFISLALLGIKLLKKNFFAQFIPTVPGWLLPFMILIEIISWLIRPISLAVRLFANMLAGHILLFIVAGGVIAMGKIYLPLMIIPQFFLMCFSLLEIFIAFLQAYVFTILLTIYMNDSYHSHNDNFNNLSLSMLIVKIKLFLNKVLNPLKQAQALYLEKRKSFILLILNTRLRSLVILFVIVMNSLIYVFSTYPKITTYLSYFYCLIFLSLPGLLFINATLWFFSYILFALMVSRIYLIIDLYLIVFDLILTKADTRILFENSILHFKKMKYFNSFFIFDIEPTYGLFWRSARTNIRTLGYFALGATMIACCGYIIVALIDAHAAITAETIKLQVTQLEVDSIRDTNATNLKIALAESNAKA